MFEDYDIVCVLGPTASGKTRYAVDLARKMDAQELAVEELGVTKAF